MNEKKSYEEWIQDLNEYKYIHFSFVPNYPQEETKFDLEKYEMFSTELGTLLVLNLIERETKKSMVFSIPDIEKVEKNESSTNSFKKYYLHCLVRPNYFKLIELQQRKEMGIPVDDEKRLALIENQYMTYRISLTNN